MHLALAVDLQRQKFGFNKILSLREQMAGNQIITFLPIRCEKVIQELHLKNKKDAD